MKYFRILILSVFAFALMAFFSRDLLKNTSSEAETPEALKDDSESVYSSSFGGGRKDIIDELYQELVGKNSAFKKVEEDIDAVNGKTGSLFTQFEQYDNKSKNYYSSADQNIATIDDSLIRAKLRAVILKSSQNYTNQTAELRSLIRQITQNNATIEDHHTVLKIITTLPIIEKYQKDSKPNKKEFEDLITQQKTLVTKIDSLTPAY